MPRLHWGARPPRAYRLAPSPDGPIGFTEAFRQGLLERVSAKAGPQHYGAELAESAEAKAERIVAEELKGRGWKWEDLVTQREGDAEKVAMAVRLRRETTMTLEWVAARLQMGEDSPGALALLGEAEGRKGSRRKHDTLTDPVTDTRSNSSVGCGMP